MINTPLQSSSHLTALGWQNEYTGWLALGRQPFPVEPAFQMVERAGLACAWWQGLPGEAENYLLAAPGYPASPMERLAAIGPQITASANAAILRLPEEEINFEWSQALAAYDFFPTGADPLMACQLAEPPYEQPMPPELTIHAVQNQADYAAALSVIQAVFQGPPSLTRFFNPTSAVRLFLGRWQGVPAASATLWPFAGIAGVFSVATLPAFRHRGLALAVVSALLAESRRTGVQMATLRTRPELFPLYQRLGFQPVGQIACYYRPLGA